MGVEQRPLLAPGGAVASSMGGQIAHAWQAAAEALPSAMGLLMPGERTAALRALGPREVSEVVVALHRAFDVPPAALGVRMGGGAAAIPPHGRVLASEEGTGHPGRAATAGEGAPADADGPPWRRWQAEAGTLTPQAQYLGGLCAALAAQPAYGRGVAFAEAAARWLQQELARRVQPPRPRDLAGPGDVSRDARGGDAGAGYGRVEQEGAAPQARVGARGSTKHTKDTKETEETEYPKGTKDTNGTPRVRVGARGSTKDTNGAREARVGDPSAEEQGKAVRVEVGRVEAAAYGRMPAGDGGVWTDLGGVLYLLHTLPWLALPGKWAAQLGAWAALELLARRLLADEAAAEPRGAGGDAKADDGAGGRANDRANDRAGDRADDAAGDALWAFLAALDGRPSGQLLGDALPPQAEQVRAAHLVAGDELAGAPPWVRRELARLWAQEAALPPAPDLPAREPPALDLLVPDLPAPAGVSAVAWRWAAPRASLLRILLRRVLGAVPVASILHVRGLLRASATHVDLYLPAAAVNLAVRRAGLDANPGWYPDCGYIVTFFFVAEAG